MVEQEVLDEEIEACLLAAIEEVSEARSRSEDGIQEALQLFVRYLNEEPIQVREAVREYSAIQATSCGQADSKQLGMADRRSFAIVVADEALRVRQFPTAGNPPSGLDSPPEPTPLIY